MHWLDDLGQASIFNVKIFWSICLSKKSSSVFQWNKLKLKTFQLRSMSKAIICTEKWFGLDIQLEPGCNMWQVIYSFFLNRSIQTSWLSGQGEYQWVWLPGFDFSRLLKVSAAIWEPVHLQYCNNIACLQWTMNNDNEQ